MFMHHVVHGATLPEAYHRALNILNHYGDVRPCPAYNTNEKSIAVTIDIARPLEEPRISKLIPCDPAALQQYLMEMQEGIMDFEHTVAGNWPYTYHDRMIEQLIGIVEILRKDPNSRRAVACIRALHDQDMEDPPCLQLIQYMITNGQLDCFVTFRSNDAVKAFFMNAFALISIQEIIADILHVKVGRYIHTANSFHCYEQDWDKLGHFSERIIQNAENSKALTMNYQEEWKDLMEESIPDIQQKVKDQIRKYGMTHPGYFVGPLYEVIKRELGG